MGPDADDARSILKYPSAWLMFAMALIGIGWVARTSEIGLIAACLVSVTILYAVAALAISRRRLAEVREELRGHRARDARAHGALEHVPALVWTSDPRSRRVFLSALWGELTGGAARECAEDDWLQWIHPEDRRQSRSVRRLAAANREPFEVEYRLRDGEHSYRWMLERGLPVVDDHGELRGFVGATVDVTERRRLEAAQVQRLEDLRRANDAVGRSVDEMAARCERLLEAKREEESAHRGPREYLEALAGDLRGPIETILDAGRLLRGAELAAGPRRDLDRVLDAAGALREVLGRGTDLAPTDGGEGAADMHECDLRRVIDEAIEGAAARAGDAAVEVGRRVAEDVPRRVRTDPRRLGRVLVDLLGAAQRLTREGPIAVDVSREARPGGRALVHVTATVPIGAAAGERVQRPFYPEEGEGEGAAPGLGLGPCRRRAESLGGRVGVRAEGADRVTLWLSIELVEINPHVDGEAEGGLLKCSLGEIVSLSLSGLRLRARKVPRGTFFIELRRGDEVVVVRGRTEQSRRLGFRRHEVLMRFVDLDPDAASRLCRLAATSSSRRAA